MPVVPHVVYAGAADAIAAVYAAVARLVHGASFAAVDRVVSEEDAAQRAVPMLGC